MLVATGLALVAVVLTWVYLRLRTDDTGLQLGAGVVFVLGFVAFRAADAGKGALGWIFLPAAAVFLAVTARGVSRDTQR